MKVSLRSSVWEVSHYYCHRAFVSSEQMKLCPNRYAKPSKQIFKKDEILSLCLHLCLSYSFSHLSIAADSHHLLPDTHWPSATKRCFSIARGTRSWWIHRVVWLLSTDTMQKHIPSSAVLWQLCSKQSFWGYSMRRGDFRKQRIVFQLIDVSFCYWRLSRRW